MNKLYQTIAIGAAAFASACVLSYAAVKGTEVYRAPDRIRESKSLMESEAFKEHVAKREEMFKRLETRMITPEKARETGQLFIRDPNVIKELIDSTYGKNPLER